MTTVGKLKALIANLPDDLPIVGCDANNQARIDYKDVHFAVEDRERNPRFKRTSPDYIKLRQHWGGQVPMKVLVCDMT